MGKTSGVRIRKAKDVTDRSKSALFMVGLAVLAGVAAPSAEARPTCQSDGTNTTCQTNGSVSIKVRPGTVAPPANQPQIPWLGSPGRRRG
jgi:hypothetical protein